MKSLETKSMVLLHHHLKALRLPTIGAECEKVAAQAATDNVDQPNRSPFRPARASLFDQHSHLGLNKEA